MGEVYDQILLSTLGTCFSQLQTWNLCICSHKTSRSRIIHLDRDHIITCADERGPRVVISGSDRLGAIPRTTYTSLSASLGSGVGHVC